MAGNSLETLLDVREETPVSPKAPPRAVTFGLAPMGDTGGPMQRTIFTTPLVSPFFRVLSLACLKLAGWEVQGQLPDHARKSVLIAAPHTSNWDLPMTIMVAFALRLRPRWMGKASIFRAPFGGIMRWLGGMPVDRSKANNLVESSAQAIRDAVDALQLIVPPEGTRSKTRHWKTGFYHIARSAEVPIVMAFMDYGTKRSGLGALFEPTGDVDADLAAIKAFYKPFKGKNADQFESEAD
jgi:1-acyl-sn-glycerol-3-phosphate acyltransferase